MLLFLRYLGLKIGLVDQPNERKQHLGSVPLTGGISTFITITVSFIFLLPLNADLLIYLFCSLALVLVGIFDDLYDLSFYWRLLIQITLTLCIFFLSGMGIVNLGNILGIGDIRLDTLFSIIISILAVLGSINAFNMVDGIDGLLGALASVSLGAIGILFFYGNQDALWVMCFIFLVAIFPYILMNLGFFGGSKKVFMGDAGSMFIGFTIVWLLIKGTQEGKSSAFSSVTALWFLAIPLMDMAAVMIRRVKNGASPFKPDREHLHHLFLAMGFSQHQTLFIIFVSSMTFAIIGVWSDFSDVRESIMFVIFLSGFVVYFLTKEYCLKLINTNASKLKETNTDINVRKGI